MRHALTFALLAAVALSGPAAPANAAQEPVLIKTLPGIVVDTKANEVRLEGEVVMQEGGLELLVCSEGTREHESVIAVKAKPSHVTFALALLGLAPGKPGFTTPGGTFSPPAGAVLEITARFTVREGEDAAEKPDVRSYPAWQLLRFSGTETGLVRPLEWVYVGRQSPEALAAADREGTVVCVSNFIDAVIDVPFESTDVNAQLVYETNPKVVPPVGTPCELIVKPTGRVIKPKKVEIEVVLKRGEPVRLDGKPIELEAFRKRTSTAPADIRSALVLAEADESFGRVMQIHDILRDALMRVTFQVLPEEKPSPGPVAAPVEIVITRDGTIRIGGETLGLEEIASRAGELLAGAERAILVPENGASWKTVAEMMEIARQAGVTTTLSQGAAAQE